MALRNVQLFAKVFNRTETEKVNRRNFIDACVDKGIAA
jgi:hypothetical protein